MRAIQASHYVQRLYDIKPKQWGKGPMTHFSPTTAMLRQVLKDPIIPKGVKGHVYSWLLYRQRNR